MLPRSVPSHRQSRAVTLRRAGALVPLTLISASWTLSVAGAQAGQSTADRAGSPDLPAAIETPDRPLDVPASVTVKRDVRSSHPTSITPAVATSGTGEIPPVALAAYQRAEAVLRRADASCHLPWTLVAAIGRVESDHGRTGGSALDGDGVAQPGVFGVRLDGSRGTARVSDSDAGRIDGDPVFDRAVGPMQFIPATWSVVAVDADGDKTRNPQDIDDAALAAAVYLCSGSEDLGTAAGMRHAVMRYNHSATYVDLVLSVARSYADGTGLTQISATSPLSVNASSSNLLPEIDAPDDGAEHHAAEQSAPSENGAHSGPDQVAAPPPGGSASGGGRSDEDDSPTPDPPAPGPLAPVTHVVTKARAILGCQLQGLVQILQPAAFRECVARALE